MGWWTDTKNFAGNAAAYGLAAPTLGVSLLGKKGVRDAVGDAFNNVTGTTQARAARAGAKDMKAAALESNAMLDKWHQQGREDMAPWLESQRENNSTLQGMMRQNAFDMPAEDLEGPAFQGGPLNVNLQQDPGYQFRMDQGQKGLMRGAAKMGGFASGATLAGLMQHGQEMGSQEFGNAYNRAADDRSFAYGQHQDQYQGRLNNYQRRYTNNQDRFSRLSGLSTPQAAGTLSGLGQQFATNYGQNLQAGANAQAAGRMGAANAQSQFYSNLMNLGGQALIGRG